MDDLAKTDSWLATRKLLWPTLHLALLVTWAHVGHRDAHGRGRLREVQGAEVSSPGMAMAAAAALLAAAFHCNLVVQYRYGRGGEGWERGDDED